MNQDIAMTRALLERLIIVDYSLTTYNAYKSKLMCDDSVQIIQLE